MHSSSVQIWAAELARAAHPALTRRYWELMNPGERQRAVRFMRHKDRHRYVVTRALARTVLAGYVCQPPEGLNFGRTPAGRPFLVAPRAGVPLPSFSISHTEDYVFLAVARHLRLGFDAESAGRQVEFAAMRRFFTAAEARYVLQHPASSRRRILELWTLKEAYVKALGLGLHLGLTSFSFAQLSSGGRVEKAFSGRGDDDGAWRFFELALPGEHLGACCVGEAPPGQVPQMQLIDCVPLCGVRIEGALPVQEVRVRKERASRTERALQERLRA